MFQLHSCVKASVLKKKKNIFWTINLQDYSTDRQISTENI